MELWQQIFAGIVIVVVGGLVGAGTTTLRIGSKLDVLTARFDSLDKDLSGMIQVVRSVTQLEVRMDNVEKDVDALARNLRSVREGHADA